MRLSLLLAALAVTGCGSRAEPVVDEPAHPPLIIPPFTPPAPEPGVLFVDGTAEATIEVMLFWIYVRADGRDSQSEPEVRRVTLKEAMELGIHPDAWWFLLTNPDAPRAFFMVKRFRS